MSSFVRFSISADSSLDIYMPLRVACSLRSPESEKGIQWKSGADAQR